MLCKLYAFNAGETVEESLDSLSMMEAHLSGFLYLKGVDSDYLLNDADCKSIGGKAPKIGPKMQALITTGSLVSRTGIGMQQASGLSVVIEGLNRWRDLSHLRAIHRGSYFAEMKTVLPRRLTGEHWGFICPVHTPDGAPCGLLNHLALNCTLPATYPNPPQIKQLKQMLTEEHRVISVDDFIHLTVDRGSYYPVVLEGCLFGYINKNQAALTMRKLRIDKCEERLYKYTEIVLLQDRSVAGQFPGLYLFTGPARFMRPVINLDTNKIEYIGSFEQTYMGIDCLSKTTGVPEDYYTHKEIDKVQMFSNIAGLVPYADCNPCPRNMYQCQMGKQTVGTPLHNWRSQTFNKCYKLQYPQVPMIRNRHYDVVDMQDHCMGFNAVVAIMSYTGYDIEDAMVINKHSIERGLGSAQMYKTERVDLLEKGRGRGLGEVNQIFKCDPNKEELNAFLDGFGLPNPGTKLKAGDPYYCTFDTRSREYRVFNYKGENCVVDKVVLCDPSDSDRPAHKATITLGCQRNPNVGDKFASRSGQKGVMSLQYRNEDMPFTEDGITPDIIFNPHGIPSRMTGGKLIELMGGKVAALYGKGFSSTSFEFNDEARATDYFGKWLEAAGFNYYGQDRMGSGIDGRTFECSIFMGVMYYQRLKHMTEDKCQVRSTGAVAPLTRQPVKGRRRGGAIRFGEMERDAVLAHGAAFTLKDRLMDCSD